MLQRLQWDGMAAERHQDQAHTAGGSDAGTVSRETAPTAEGCGVNATYVIERQDAVVDDASKQIWKVFQNTTSVR